MCARTSPPVPPPLCLWTRALHSRNLLTGVCALTSPPASSSVPLDARSSLKELLTGVCALTSPPASSSVPLDARSSLKESTHRCVCADFSTCLLLCAFGRALFTQGTTHRCVCADFSTCLLCAFGRALFTQGIYSQVLFWTVLEPPVDTTLVQQVEPEQPPKPWSDARSSLNKKPV